MSEIAKDGYKLLTDLEVLPGLANSRQLKIKWKWSSISHAKALLHQAKIFYYNDVDIEYPGYSVIPDPEDTELLLEDLRPDTKYTICLHITRRKFGANDHPNLVGTKLQNEPMKSLEPINLRQPIPRLGTSRFQPHSPRTTNQYLTEMECQVAFTRLVHWPALICSAVGILLAFLISLTIYFVFKSLKSKQNPSEKVQTSRFCKTHSRSFHVSTKTQNDFHSGSHSSSSSRHSRHSIHHHPFQKHQKSVPTEHTPLDSTGLRKPCLKVDKAKNISDEPSGKKQTNSDLQSLQIEKRNLSDKTDKEPSQLICLDVIHTECTSSASGLDSYPFSSTTSIVDSHPEDGVHSSYTSGNSPSQLITCCSESNEPGKDHCQLSLDRFNNFKRTVSFVDQTTRHTADQAAQVQNQLEVTNRSGTKSRGESGNQQNHHHHHHLHRDREPSIITERNSESSCTLTLPCPTLLSNQGPRLSKPSSDEYLCGENSPIPESVEQPSAASMYDSIPISCKDPLATVETFSSIEDSQVLSPLLKEHDIGLQSSRTKADESLICDKESQRLEATETGGITSIDYDVDPNTKTESAPITDEEKTPNFAETPLDPLYMPRSGHDFIEQAESSSIFHTQLIETL